MKIKGNETRRSEELQMPDLTNTLTSGHIIRNKVTSKHLYGAPRFNAIFPPLATTLNQKKKKPSPHHHSL